MSRRVLAPLTAVLGVGLASAWPWDRVFSDRSWLVPLLLAVMVPGLIAGVGRRWRVPSLVSFAIHVAAFAAVAAGVLVAAGELIDGLFGGWSLMLATTLPLDGSIESTLLVVPTALVWLGTGVAAELAMRTDLRATVLAFAAVAFTAALAQGASMDVDATRYGAAFLVAAVLWLLVRNWSLIPPEALLVAADEAGPARSFGGRSIISGAVAAVVVVGGLLIGPAVLGANGAPTDLHAAEEPDFVPRPALNPLSRVTSQSLEPTAPAGEDGVIGPVTPILRISIPDGVAADAVSIPGCVLIREEAPSGCLRTVTLDTYDGQVWATTGTYRRSGVQLRSAVPSLRATGERRSMVIEPTPDFAGQWLPLPDHALSMDAGTTVLADAANGSVVVAPGEPVPGSYEVEWQPLESSDDVLADGGVAVEAPCRAVRCEPGSAVSAFSGEDQATLTRVGSELLRAGRSPATAVDVTNGLNELLKSIKQLSPAADPIQGGHQVPRLSEFLPEAETADAASTLAAIEASDPSIPERTAALAAVLADAAGLRSRVAVGYKIPAFEAGTAVIHQGDAHAWLEVDLGPGLGWTAFDVSPSSSAAELDAIKDALRCEADPEAEGCTQDEPRDEPVSEGTGGESATPASPEPAEPNNSGTSDTGQPTSKAEQSLDLIRWLGPGFLGILVLALVAVPVAKSLRRRRRQSGSERDRVIGAWHEIVDRLRDSGAELGPARAADQVAAVAASHRSGLGEPVFALAAQANRAAYWTAPMESGSGDAAWHRLAAAEAALRAEERAVGRARRFLSPASLVGG